MQIWKFIPAQKTELTLHSTFHLKKTNIKQINFQFTMLGFTCEVIYNKNEKWMDDRPV